jgi:hypothetical protein
MDRMAAVACAKSSCASQLAVQVMPNQIQECLPRSIPIVGSSMGRLLRSPLIPQRLAGSRRRTMPSVILRPHTRTGQTTSTYNGTFMPANIVQSQLISSSSTKNTQTNMDTLGRPVQTSRTYFSSKSQIDPRAEFLDESLHFHLCNEIVCLTLPFKILADSMR